MKNFFHKIVLKIKDLKKLKNILICFSVGLVISTLICTSIISFQLFENLMVKKISESRVDVLSLVSEKITAIKSSADMISDMFYYNENLSTYHCNETYTDQEKALIQERIDGIESLLGMTRTISELEFDYLFLMNNGYKYGSVPQEDLERYSLDYYRNEIWFLQLMEKKEVWVPTYTDGKNRNIISYVRGIYKEDNELIGLFMFNIYEETIRKCYESFQGEPMIYIVDNEGNIISHKDQELIGIHFYDMEVMEEMFSEENYRVIEKNKEKYLFSVFKNENMDWMIVEEIPFSLLLKDVNHIKLQMTLAALGIFTISIFICFYIAKRTTTPLAELVSGLKEIGRSEKNDQIFDVTGWKEIEEICQECDYMNRRIQSLVETIKVTEKEKRFAEMGFMQSQMSPHFLYNTLFSIRCMVDMGNKKEAIAVIDDFTSILKYILSYKSEYVEIVQEIRFLEEYASLHKYRYGGQFTLEIQCPENLYRKKILRMMIEPLVENALFHGLDGEIEQIHVVVRFKENEGDLYIEVIDDGIGFTNKNYEELHEKIRKNEQSNMIGMNNIRQRIKLHYGAKYSLSIDVNYADGARVIIKVPMIE